MRALLSMLPAFVVCASCATAPTQEEDLSQNPLLQKFGELAQKKNAIRDDETIAPLDRLFAMKGVENEIHAKFSSTSPEITEIGRLIFKAYLTNQGISYIEALNNQSDHPLYPVMQQMNEATNDYAGLNLPLPTVWLVDDLLEKQGRTVLYQEYGDIILIDSSLSNEEKAYLMAYEFGSRTTNKLFEIEVDATQIYSLIQKLLPVTEAFEHAGDILATSAHIMRECELAESAIGHYLSLKVMPEIDPLEMAKNIEISGLTQEDDDFIRDNLTFADHPARSMTIEFLERLEDEGFFEQNRYPTAKTTYECNIPFVPKGM